MGGFFGRVGAGLENLTYWKVEKYRITK